MRQRLSDSQPILVHMLNLLHTLLDAQNMEKIGRDNGEVQNIAIEPNDDCNRLDRKSTRLNSSHT